MNAQTILADLQARFGQEQDVLYPEDLAKILAKAPNVETLLCSGGLPLKVVKQGDRPAVSIYEAALWLAGGESQQGQASNAPAPAPDTSKPHRRRPSLGRALLALRSQQEFLAELYAEMEAIEIAEVTAESDITKRRDPP